MKLYQKIARVLSQKNKSLNVIEKELTLLKELLPNGNVIGLQRHNLSTVSCIISLKSTHKRIVKDYLHDIFSEALMKEYVVFKKGWDVKDSSEIESELESELD